MKLSMKMDCLTSDMVHMLEASLKYYDAKLTVHNGTTKLDANVSDKEYAELMVLTSCFEPYDVHLSR
jgi:hypothetical protein